MFHALYNKFMLKFGWHLSDHEDTDLAEVYNFGIVVHTLLLVMHNT